jgi:hypothetical protein
MVIDCVNNLIILERSAISILMENETMRNEFFQSVYQAVIEILGRQEAMKVFNAVLGPDYSEDAPLFDPKTNLLTGISDEFSILYQLNTARGLLIRIGDAAFSKMCKKLDALNALGEIENRLRPFNQKFESSVIKLGDILSAASGKTITFESTKNDCYCMHLSDRSLQSYFYAGFLRAFGIWMDSRRDYQAVVRSGDSEKDHDEVCLCVSAAQ